MWNSKKIMVNVISVIILKMLVRQILSSKIQIILLSALFPLPQLLFFPVSIPPLLSFSFLTASTDLKIVLIVGTILDVGWQRNLSWISRQLWVTTGAHNEGREENGGRSKKCLCHLIENLKHSHAACFNNKKTEAVDVLYMYYITWSYMVQTRRRGMLVADSLSIVYVMGFRIFWWAIGTFVLPIKGKPPQRSAGLLIKRYHMEAKEEQAISTYTRQEGFMSSVYRDISAFHQWSGQVWSPEVLQWENSKRHAATLSNSSRSHDHSHAWKFRRLIFYNNPKS